MSAYDNESEVPSWNNRWALDTFSSVWLSRDGVLVLFVSVCLSGHLGNMPFCRCNWSMCGMFLMQHFFASFLSRDEAYRLIMDGWVQHSSYAKCFLSGQESLASFAVVNTHWCFLYLMYIWECWCTFLCIDAHDLSLFWFIVNRITAMYGYSLETLSCSCILHNVEISIGHTFPPLKMYLYRNRPFLCFPDMLEGGSSRERFDTWNCWFWCWPGHKLNLYEDSSGLSWQFCCC